MYHFNFLVFFLIVFCYFLNLQEFGQCGLLMVVAAVVVTDFVVQDRKSTRLNSSH